MKKKLHVGDCVTLKSKEELLVLSKKFLTTGITKKMAEYGGEEAIIKNIKTYVNEPEGYKLDIDNETWVWPKIAFEG